MSQDKVSSLTLKQDRNGLTETTVMIDTDHELSKPELKEAVSSLLDIRPVTKFPRRETRITDPEIPNQRFALVSFVPAVGSKPDSKNMYGSMKVRGAYSSLEEASEKAKELIKKVDSYHKIYTVHVGKPFPITVSSDYSGEVDEVQLDKQLAEMYSNDIKAKREKDERDMKEIQEREKNLTAEIKRETEDPLEYYTMIQVKRANLLWTYMKTDEKMSEMRSSIVKVRKEISDFDEKEPELRKQYFNKYMEARKNSNIDEEKAQDNFMKYMCEDIELNYLRDDYVEKPRKPVDTSVPFKFSDTVLLKARNKVVSITDEKQKSELLTKLEVVSSLLNDMMTMKNTDDRLETTVNNLLINAIELQSLVE